MPLPFVGFAHIAMNKADDSTDNDSYHYACAGKHVVRLDVHAWDKNVSLHPGLWQSV
jgi:hypothetical protein